MSSSRILPLRYGALLFFFCLAIQTVVIAALAPFLDIERFGTELYLTLFSELTAAVAAVLIIGSIGARHDLIRVGFCLKRSLAGCLEAFIGYLFFLPIFIFVVCRLNTYLVGDEQQQIVESIIDNPELLHSIPFLLSVCVAVPILEEILFRGILYSGLRHMLKPWAAILISSAVFGALHGWTAAFPILTLGYYLGAVRERNYSLLPVILVHVGHNSLTLFSIHLLY